MRVTKKARLGQNFLADRQAAEKIVAALGDVSRSLVVEIGPGHGALTDILLRQAGQVLAIELDSVLAAELRRKSADAANLQVLEADVLAVDFRTVLSGLLDRTSHPPARARLLGNLPYYITSPILLRICEFHEMFDQAVLMVQREVAVRIAAAPGSRDYGLLSATTQLYARVEMLFTLPPSAFVPRPEVYSSVLRLRIAPRFDELDVQAGDFLPFLRLAFAMKRKTLVNNLKQGYGEEEIRAALRQASLRPDVRAEAIPLEAMAAVFRTLRDGGTEAGKINASKIDDGQSRL